MHAHRTTHRGLGAVDYEAFSRILSATAPLMDADARDVASLVIEIMSVERQPGGLLDPRTPSTFQVGDLKTPLRTYLFFRKYPWALVAFPVGALVIAYLLGRSST